MPGYDPIVVMEYGRILEQGTHEELLSRLGPYCELRQGSFGQEAQSG